jgi:hypothetical protein
MFFIVLLLCSALAVSAVAGWFSIVGLMAIFPGVPVPILTMGIVLEVAKLVTASWLYRNWNTAQMLHKFYLTLSVVVLSFITSMGIYGFLSKAHIEQTITMGGDNALQIESIERRIGNERRVITDAENVIASLDASVQILQDYDRIRGPDGALAVRASQAEERQSLNASIEQAIQNIESLEDNLRPLRQMALQQEAEVGPVKYIAALIYENPEEMLDNTVRIVVILIVLVFDPLAILLVIAANQSLLQRRGEQISFVTIDNVEPEPEDFGIDPDIDGDGTPDFTDTELSQFNRLDRSLRSKLSWLVDKKRKDDGKE